MVETPTHVLAPFLVSSHNNLYTEDPEHEKVDKNLYYLQLNYLMFWPLPASLPSQATNYKHVPCTNKTSNQFLQM